MITRESLIIWLFFAKVFIIINKQVAHDIHMAVGNFEHIPGKCGAAEHLERSLSKNSIYAIQIDSTM